ncbi:MULTISPECIES: hypothetical protein [unclassified Streptomyces]|uniref:hypothetical protein n=1 Tax=unclassified Streptomyces TaxID=2593676 RepID=UPI00372458D6
MAESVEHAFLSDTALDVIKEASKSQLFGCKESGRKRFDFSCDLTRDWERVVSGQTLWRHDRDGIDKDLRTLLTDSETAAAVYVARDTVATRGRVEEVIRDYRNSPLRPNLSKLRIFWVPADFDADSEEGRAVVRGGLRHEIHRDLLLTVALGGLSSVDVREFCRSGRLGCSPWLLAQIAKDGYAGNYTHASKRYGMGVPALKEELLRLELTGMLSREVNDHGLIGVTEKGRAMLDICAYLHAYLSGSASGGDELLYVCSLLGIDFSEISSGGQKVDFDFYRTNQRDLHPVALAGNSTLILNSLYWTSQYGEIEWPLPRYGLSLD